MKWAKLGMNLKEGWALGLFRYAFM
jgi:hypothetical protein